MDLFAQPAPMAITASKPFAECAPSSGLEESAQHPESFLVDLDALDGEILGLRIARFFGEIA